MIKSDSDCWVLGGKEFRSRLIIGSGKFKNFEENLEALEASGAEMITVAKNSPKVSVFVSKKTSQFYKILS